MFIPYALVQQTTTTPSNILKAKNTENEKGLINIYTPKQKIVRIASNRPPD